MSLSKPLRAARCAAVVALSLAGLAATTSASAANLSISCGAVGMELELCKEASEAWARKTGNTVKVVSTPDSTTERLALYQQLLAAGASDIDVFQIDVIWPGILANHLVDLNKYANAKVTAGFFPEMLKNDVVGGKLVALPWFTDAGVLYYRKDLLAKYKAKVPDTWEELAATARQIQDGERAAGNAKMQGFVFQAKAYEGLTCDAMEWIVSYNGGNIVDGSGRITINNPQAVTALKTASGWIGTIAPKGVLNYGEEEARGVFQSGDAVFMRNWPYAWMLSQSADSVVKNKVGVAALPKGGAGGRHAATLGGWQLAVSRYSRNPDAAADLVLYLTSAAEQKHRAIKGSYNPTMPALYKDQDVLAANPFFGSLYDTFVSAVPRPSTVTASRYNQVSSEFWNAVYSSLSGQSSADEAFKGLEGKLKHLARGGKW